MSLPYVLMSLNAKQLQTLQELLQLPPLPKDRSHAALALADHLQSEEGFQLVWRALSALELRVYMATLFEMQVDGYAAAIPTVRLLPALKEYFVEDRSVLQIALERLVSLALLTRQETWYVGEAYSIPEELREQVFSHFVEDVLFAQQENEAFAIADIDVAVFERSGRMLIRDLVRFATYVTKYPLQLTKSSIPYKRELPKLKNYLRSMQVEGIHGSGAWDSMPFAVVACIFILEDLGVIDRSLDVVRVHGKALQKFIFTSDEMLREQIFRTLPRLVSGLHPYLVATLSRWLKKLPLGQWIGVHRLLQVTLNLQVGRYAPVWFQTLDSFLRIAAACGLVELGSHPNMGVVMRVTDWAKSASQKFVIQPNLDVLVPEDAPTWVHFLVGTLAELKRADEMSLYHINRDSVLLLCDRGWSFTDIERVLRTFSESDPAQAVLRSISDWVGAYDRAVLWDVLLVRFASAEVFHAFVSDQRAKNCIVESIGEEAVILRRSEEVLVRQILSELGAPAPQQVRLAPGDEAHLRTRVGAKQGGMRSKGTKEDQTALANLLSPKIIDLAQKAMQL
ncbi:helicase-associated domain-containing protein [Sulfoacidibacillus thermotolerans]|uniref:Helicase XPB/Ssl2 N-terminal domain-containing protein n=1 Tax=Sulfoacidibacillus thermotolerans TaxID=1765684 RepID=A0A2U3DAL8_SULT2|nr:helicase-associated domain-containing protein [Sulfoacidibacillus thermotolerans]PWI58326.1 hypothetical protein BM613_03650 [Sulfoacidibacillus thermotolerans]